MSEANSGLHWTICTSGGRIRSQCALERRERLLACALRADKTSVSVPMVDGELVAGAWQQAVAIISTTGCGERELVTVIVWLGR
jgi:hypothetical protein